MKRIKKKKKMLGPVITIILLTFIIIVTSTVFSLLQIDAEQTSIVKSSLETSVVTVNNILTRDGIKYILGNIITNLQLFEPLVLLIISLITVSIGEASGIFQAIFRPLSKINPKFLTFLMPMKVTDSCILYEYC